MTPPFEVAPANFHKHGLPFAKEGLYRHVLFSFLRDINEADVLSPLVYGRWRRK
jgi:hypothetical protein